MTGMSTEPGPFMGRRGCITEIFKKRVLTSHKGQYLGVLHRKWENVEICVISIVVRNFVTFCHCST